MSTENQNKIEDELLNKKTPCQTIITIEGERILKNKIKYRSEVAAQRKANNHNLKKGTTEMVDAYQCSECGEWHIGRNGKKLTKSSKGKLIMEKVKFTVVGKIDLSKFDKKVQKQKAEEAKAKKAKQEARKKKNARLNEIKRNIKQEKLKTITLEDLKNLGGDIAGE
jgi:hypothetical protein